ncbi:MAG: ATP-binding protein [Alphaproteobacteria bacterium]|nr:ATP-binding protein [Alphaproteobacteria bacterium]
MVASADDTLLPSKDGLTNAASPSGERAVPSETSQRFDTLHTSLVGMMAIVLILLAAVALPIFGYAPVTDKGSFFIITAATFGGIGYLCFLNYAVYKLVCDHDRLNEVLMDSLGQGFLSFGHDGLCDSVYSNACLDLLQTSPAGKNIMDVLRIPEEGREDFKGWLDILFMPDHALGFSDVINFLPQFFPHEKKRRITLMYRPIYTKGRMLSRVVLIATDTTEEFEAQELAKRRQDYADMICRIFRERNQFLATITHVRSFLERAAEPVSRENSVSLLRLLHTLKAAVKHFHLADLASTVHSLETELRSDSIESEEAFRNALEAGRQLIDKQLNVVLDTIRELIGQDYEGRGNTREIEESALYNFALVMSVSGVNQDVVDHYLRFIVAVPIQDCFRQFERELLDLAEITGKQIKPVRFSGSNPPVLFREYQGLIFSLTHVSRNIIDHGIEPSVTRLARGKDPAGQISVEANIVRDKAEGKDWLYLIISDDGNGIDVAQVRERLALLEPEERWSEKDDQTVMQSIFSFGVSTREEVTETSGRGVGMNVVKREVENLNGEIHVSSELCVGTRFEIKVPYVLSI